LTRRPPAALPSCPYSGSSRPSGWCVPAGHGRRLARNVPPTSDDTHADAQTVPSFVGSTREEAGRSAPGQASRPTPALPRTCTLPAVLDPSTPPLRSGSALLRLDGPPRARQTTLIGAGRVGSEDSARSLGHPAHSQCRPGRAAGGTGGE
jgi:hypothetical protein